MDCCEEMLLPPFSLKQHEKQKLMTQRLKKLTRHHYKNCSAYQRIMDALGVEMKQLQSLETIPFLPVSLFKQMELVSVGQEQLIKIMTSSGTSGQKLSKICLDKITAINQQKALVKIVSDFTGQARMPMLIIDTPDVMANRNSFSARGAGILGFSLFGSEKTWALKSDMSLDMPAISHFLQKHRGKRVLIFGFTFIIWQHFYKQLLQINQKIDLSSGILIHGGGWKKLISAAVSPEYFSAALQRQCGIAHNHDYYGMVEQTGTIFMQCEYGHLHASVFSDIIIRNPIDFSVCRHGEPGIIQVLSVIPESYPGHALLTEDRGVILGIDDCPCGRYGKYFSVIGRVENAELRGCSDTYAEQF